MSVSLDDRHTAECARIAALLERRYPGARVIDEPELRHRERLAGRALASAGMGFYPGGAQRLHRPDLVILPDGRLPVEEGAELPVAVEVELSAKTRRMLYGILRAWGRSQLVAGALYIAAERVQTALRSTIVATGVGERVWVAPLHAFQPGAVPIGAAERAVPSEA